MKHEKSEAHEKDVTRIHLIHSHAQWTLSNKGSNPVEVIIYVIIFTRSLFVFGGWLPGIGFLRSYAAQSGGLVTLSCMLTS